MMLRRLYGGGAFAGCPNSVLDRVFQEESAERVLVEVLDILA
jgi:hypothetical protein